MTKNPLMFRLLLVALLTGLVIVSVGAITSASALSFQVQKDSDSGAETLEGTPPPDVMGKVDEVENDASKTVRDTTGVDVDNVGSSVNDPNELIPDDVDGATDAAPHGTSASSEETRPMTTEDTAAAGVLAAASGAGFLFWLHNVLGIGFGRLFMTPLFSRIQKDDLLDNQTRDLVVTLVNENPGIGLKEISERGGLGWGTTVYHTSRLEKAGMIVSLKNGQNRHFFKNGHPAALMKQHVAVLRNETAGNLARFLLATPGSTQSTIAKRLGIGAPTVTKYVKRMEQQGLVQVVQDGRSKIVQPTGALQSALDHAAPMPEAPQPAPMMPQQSAVGVA